MKVNDYLSSSDESDGSINNRKANKTAKREQKNKIVRNIFLNVSKGDSGAKGKGQVMIVGHTEDTSQKTVGNRDFNQFSCTKTNNHNLAPSIPILCKIDLSRLSRIPGERNSRLSIDKHSMVSCLNGILFIFSTYKKLTLLLKNIEFKMKIENNSIFLERKCWHSKWWSTVFEQELFP